jgi:hypothetical protein
MKMKMVLLGSALAMLQLGAMGCAKSGEANENTTPSAAATPEETPPASVDSRKWIGGGPASTGPSSDQLGPTTPPSEQKETRPGSALGRHDGGVSSIAPDFEPIAMLSIGQGLPGAGGSASGLGGSAAGVGGSTGVGGTTGAGGVNGQGGSSGTGGYSASGGSIRP